MNYSIVNDFVGVDHGTNPIDLTGIKQRIFTEMRPIAIHHKLDGQIDNGPSFCIVMSSVPAGSIVYGQVSLNMLTKALDTIGYTLKKKDAPAEAS